MKLTEEQKQLLADAIATYGELLARVDSWKPKECEE